MTSPDKKLDDGGPAFPLTGATCGMNGLSLRQYAAIKLMVPESGTPWLDEMILKAKRDQFAGQVMDGWVSAATGPLHAEPDFDIVQNAAKQSFRFADALLAARKGGES